MGENVIIFGTGSFAEVARFYLENDSDHRVVAFTATSDSIAGDEFGGLPLVPFERLTELYPPDRYKLFIAIAYSKLNSVRETFFNQAKAMGYGCISYVCSRAVVWGGIAMGENCFVFEHNTIQPFVTLGDNVILWSGNHIGHHSSIGSHCFLASHVVVSGNVTIGRNCFIGVNATLRDNITIGDRNLIGPNSLIMKRTRDGDVFLAESTPRHARDSGWFMR